MNATNELFIKEILTGGLIVVDIDPLKLEVGVTVVGTSGVNTVLIRDDFPELEGKDGIKFRG